MGMVVRVVRGTCCERGGEVSVYRRGEEGLRSGLFGLEGDGLEDFVALDDVI